MTLAVTKPPWSIKWRCTLSLAGQWLILLDSGVNFLFFLIFTNKQNLPFYRLYLNFFDAFLPCLPLHIIFTGQVSQQTGTGWERFVKSIKVDKDQSQVDRRKNLDSLHGKKTYNMATCPNLPWSYRCTPDLVSMGKKNPTTWLPALACHSLTDVRSTRKRTYTDIRVSVYANIPRIFYVRLAWI